MCSMSWENTVRPRFIHHSDAGPGSAGKATGTVLSSNRKISAHPYPNDFTRFARQVTHNSRTLVPTTHYRAVCSNPSAPGPSMDHGINIIHDIQFTFRTLRKNPAFG